MTPVRILAALAALLALDCAAAPFAARLGAERLVLDTPPGFSDSLPLASPRLNELAESLTSASNRILLFGIADGDLRKFMNGDPMDLRRYLLAVTPAGLERTNVDARTFAAFVGESLRELGRPAGTGELTKYLDEQPHGKASLLAELRRDPEVVSVLQGTRLPPLRQSWNEKPQYLLSTTTLVLLRGRALNLSVYSGYDGPADLEWIRITTQRWVDELLRLNPR